jgi:hypothetical protein
MSRLLACIVWYSAAAPSSDRQVYEVFRQGWRVVFWGRVRRKAEHLPVRKLSAASLEAASRKLYPTRLGVTSLALAPARPKHHGAVSREFATSLSAQGNDTSLSNDTATPDCDNNLASQTRSPFSDWTSNIRLLFMSHLSRSIHCLAYFVLVKIQQYECSNARVL